MGVRVELGRFSTGRGGRREEVGGDKVGSERERLRDSLSRGLGGLVSVSTG